MDDRMSLITAPELAKQLDVSESLIYRLARKGEIPSYRVGPLIRFDLEEVLEALEQEAAS
jgi:excisionase family DNA binding protein